MPQWKKLPHQGIIFKRTLWVLFAQYKAALALTDLGQGKLNPTDLTVVPNPTFSNQLQFLVETQLL